MRWIDSLDEIENVTKINYYYHHRYYVYYHLCWIQFQENWTNLTELYKFIQLKAFDFPMKNKTNKLHKNEIANDWTKHEQNNRKKINNTHKHTQNNQ